MLDRVLVGVLVVSTMGVAGVVGGDLIAWRTASAEASRHSAAAEALAAQPDRPALAAEPAEVRGATPLQPRPTRTSRPDRRTPRPATAPPPAPLSVLPPLVPVPVVPDPVLRSIPPAPVPTSSPVNTSPTDVTITQANIKQGMPNDRFARDLAVVASTRPDFITLNEVGHRPDSQIRPAGYTSYRAKGSPYLAETPVLWRTDRWTAIDQGSRWMTTRKVRWGERAVNWVTLRSTTGQVVSVVSAHPAPTVRRTAGLLPVFIDNLADLVADLRAAGPVLVGGDFNAGFQGPLYPGAKLAAAGLTPTFAKFGKPAGGTGDRYGATIDYVFHTDGLTPTAQSTRELNSDHDAVLATFRLG